MPQAVRDDRGVTDEQATPACWCWRRPPSGGSRDAPPRLAEELASADVVAAEDTRRLRRLTTDLGVTVTGRVVSYFEGNESARTPVLVEALLAGERVLAGDRRRHAARCPTPATGWWRRRSSTASPSPPYPGPRRC